MADQTRREDTTPTPPVGYIVEANPRRSRFTILGRILWALVGLVSGLVAIFVIFYYNGFNFSTNF